VNRKIFDIQASKQMSQKTLLAEKMKREN